MHGRYEIWEGLHIVTETSYYGMTPCEWDMGSACSRASCNVTLTKVRCLVPRLVFLVPRPLLAGSLGTKLHFIPKRPGNEASQVAILYQYIALGMHAEGPAA